MHVGQLMPCNHIIYYMRLNIESVPLEDGNTIIVLIRK